MVQITTVSVIVAATIAMKVAPAMSAPVFQEEHQSRDLNELDARSGRAGKVAGSVFDAIGQDKLKKKINDFTKPPPPAFVVPLAAAGKKMTGGFDPKIVNAVVNSHKKKTRRDLADFDLEARSGRAGKIAGSVFDALGQDKLKKKVNELTKPPPPAFVTPLAAAGRKMTGGFDPKLVNAVVHPKKKTRRDIADFDLEARSGRAGKIAGSVFDALGQDKLKKKVNELTKPPPPAFVTPLAAAGRKMTGGFDPKLVHAVVNPKKKTRRDIADFDLEARSGRAGKIAGSVFDALGQDKLKKKVNEFTKPPPPAFVTPLAAAGRKMTGGFDPKLVNAVVNPKKKTRRDLEELYARFLDELVERDLDELDA